MLTIPSFKYYICEKTLFMLEMNEFIDTYSDDLLYLMDFRESHLTHPGKKATPFLLNASLARIFSAFMIGSIEAMIEHWRDKDTNNILEAYFINGSNEDRINALFKNFENNGIDVNQDILKKYLAIKYLRNSLIHSSWNENQKNFIKLMGFPTDTRKLNETHLEIMYEVNVEMMKYIAATEFKEFSQAKLNTRLPNIKRYFTKKELAGYLWNNLERLDMEISNNNELDYDLIEEVLFDWNLYKELKVKNVIDIVSIDKNISILEEIVNSKKYSAIPIGFFNLSEIQSKSDNKQLMNSAEKVLNMNTDEILLFINAFKQGEKSYDIMTNITVCALLKKLSHKVESAKKTEIENESLLADKLFKLARLYYSYAERH